MIGVPVVTDLMVGVGFMTAVALLMPLAARWMEHSYPDDEAYFLTSMVGVALTAVFSGGIAGFVAASFLVEGMMRVAVLGIGAVLSIALIVVFWRLLRKPQKVDGSERANQAADTRLHRA